MELEVNLIDFDKIYKAIENLNGVQSDKVIQQGLKDAAKLFINAGKDNLKNRLIDTGRNELLTSFRTKLKRAKLGALAGFNTGGSAAHLVDSGTEERYNKKGQYRGKVIGNHFWVDAILQNQNEAIDKIYSGIERGIMNLMTK